VDVLAFLRVFWDYCAEHRDEDLGGGHLAGRWIDGDLLDGGLDKHFVGCDIMVTNQRRRAPLELAIKTAEHEHPQPAGWLSRYSSQTTIRLTPERLRGGKSS
jgi:hypothetical protein